ncbi:nuclear polyadenylated RNA-binding protein 3 isoform X2 [Oryza brachyantha]|uniref:nuclear polyadenylated RNA-binding protein 3 isoform X2 n=1 Tax=Oryza brachyantha TaxID=4533 RepID=UPI001ADB78EB|nr:nuclear polyadenylated RNA-binding protein 3 isoform X2 [Oryza brachyantha]
MAAAARKGKGTVTPLGAVFSPAETRRAVARVAGAVADRRAELSRLQGFVADNAALVSLVQRLPDELSHDVMVLLGEGYYVERSAKQTTEILHRRGMELEAQVEAMKATIADLEAEAKFFESTAAEASEGLVEIREEYDEDTEINSSTSEVSSSASGMSDKDREHARIMARLDELEMEEKDAGSTSEEDEEDDEDDEEDAGPSEDDEEDEEERNILRDKYDHHNASLGASFSGSDGNDWSHESAQLKSALKKPGGREILKSASFTPSSSTPHSVFPGQTSIINSEIQLPVKKAVSFQDDNKHTVDPSKSLPLPRGPKHSSSILEVSSDNTKSHDRKIISSGQKAFTGSIIEHDDNIATLQPSKSDSLQNPASSSSRPVSRFKMQKGGR